MKNTPNAFINLS